MRIANCIAWIILLIGGLNWLLVGISGWNLVSALFGINIFSSIVYVLVGLSAIVTALTIHQCERLEEKECDEYGRCTF